MSDCCRTSTDTIGNLYFEIGDDSTPVIMITAHADEVGFQIVHIDANGFVYIRDVAPIDKQTLLGSTVMTYSKQCGIMYGVVGKKSPHIQSKQEKESFVTTEDIWIDFFLKIELFVLSNIEIGDYITLAANPQLINNHKIVSKGLDDKLGVFVLTEVIKRLKTEDIKHKVVSVVTTQEEIGGRGSIIAAQIVKPDIAICIDLGISTDIPTNISKQHIPFSLGKGVGLMKNADNNQHLVDLVKQIADKEGIPYQIYLGNRPTGGNEASKIQLQNQGIPTMNICIPNRYMHSAVEMCDLNDVENAIDLLSKIVLSLKDSRKENFSLF